MREQHAFRWVVQNGKQFALGRDEHAGADCVDDLQGEEEPLEQGAQSVQTGIRRQLLRRQIRVVGHVIKVRHVHPRAKPDIGRAISGKQSVQVAMPDLGALLELCKFVGGPCDQFVAPAGEPALPPSGTVRIASWKWSRSVKSTWPSTTNRSMSLSGRASPRR